MAFSSYLPVPVLLTGQAPLDPCQPLLCFLSGPPLSRALPPHQTQSKGPVCAADFHTRPLGAKGKAGGGLQFCSVGPPGLISMQPGAAGQKWWAGAETLPLGPKPSPASPSSSPLLANNRRGLCVWWEGRRWPDTSTSVLRNWVGRDVHKHREIIAPLTCEGRGGVGRKWLFTKHLPIGCHEF